MATPRPPLRKLNSSGRVSGSYGHNPKKDLFGHNTFSRCGWASQIRTEGKLKFADYQGRYIRDFVGDLNNSLMAAGDALNKPGIVGTSPYTYQTTITPDDAACPFGKPA